MRTAIVRSSIVENVIEGTVDAAVHPGGTLVDVTNIFCGPGFTYDGTTFSPPVIQEQRHISRLALKRRWPRAKWRSMLAAQAADETVMDFKDSLTWAKFIDLDDAELQAGLTALTQTSTPAAYRLTAAEASAILNAPIADNERA